MTDDKESLRAPPVRGEAMRRRILRAAEALLASGGADFTMRELAAKAGVSFATPFNQFGGKPGIMQALSAERIAAMAARLRAAQPAGDAAARVLAAVEIAVAVMLEDSQVNRAVIGALGAPTGEPGAVHRTSRDLWAQALGDGDGLSEEKALGLAVLPDHLAAVFRGVLSFWTAGEFGDDDFRIRAGQGAAALLLAFVSSARRAELLELLGR